MQPDNFKDPGPQQTSPAREMTLGELERENQSLRDQVRKLQLVRENQRLRNAIAFGNY